VQGQGAAAPGCGRNRELTICGEAIETLSWGGLTIKVPQSTAAAFALVIQIAVAVALFSVITAAAIFLNFVTDYCEVNHLAPAPVLYGMRALEFLLWAGDVICFVLLIAVEVWKFCVTVWQGRGA
jgi:hypothetical protein